jgi:methionyl-tRNA synthetase
VTRPWELAKAQEVTASRRLDAVLAVLLGSCRTIARELEPFLPDAAARIGQALDARDAELGRALFAKVPG